ncbi:MAG: hypothetical protein R2822_15515 [Spirosomataceae bacterium]
MTNVLLAHVVPNRGVFTNLTSGNVVTAGTAPITVTVGKGFSYVELEMEQQCQRNKC